MHKSFQIYKSMRTQNLTFVRMYTFRMKPTESFINEAPALATFTA